MGKAFGNKLAKNERSVFRKGDNYSTPHSFTELLFEKEEFNLFKTVLEPAAGVGEMVFVLKKYFEHVIDYDPVYGSSIFSGINNYDFLTYNFSEYFPYIITNPPYSLADEFVIRAKELYLEKICFLLRINYLSGQKRLKKGVFENLKNVYVFNRMPDLRAEIRKDGKFPTAMIVYAWFVWEKGYQGNPVIDWIDCSRYVLHKNK